MSQAVYAEAEAGAAALRRRGVDLERVAKQLRSIRACSRAQAPSAAATTTAATPSAATAPTPPASDAAQTGKGQAALDRLAAPEENALAMAQIGTEISGVQQGHEHLSSPAVQPAAELILSDSKPAPSGSEANAATAMQHAAKLAQTLHDQSPQALPKADVVQQPAQHEQVSAAEPSSSADVQHAAESAEETRQHGMPSDCCGGLPVSAPGLVVWGSVKGWPSWPGIVLTEEEMDVAGVQGKQGQILKGTVGILLLRLKAETNAAVVQGKQAQVLAD